MRRVPYAALLAAVLLAAFVLAASADHEGLEKRAPVKKYVKAVTWYVTINDEGK